jgi:hypothetical protein
MLMVVEEIVERGSGVLWIDNMGTVWAAVNQTSRSLVVYTVVKFILDVADGLGVKVKLCHTGRRSSVGEQVVDHLNKGKVKQAKALVELKESRKMGMSKVLGRWFNNLRPEVGLGRRCLQEVVARVPV